ncbi:MAG: SdpI family protein [Candidatus Methanomethylicaceae archaeon]|nr:SdpI family protein [Candidatus Verstraetearchaeota archaeon]
MIKYIVLIFISIFFIFGIISYPYLPDKIASHWNAKGEVDGYLPKLSIFLLPLIYSGISSLFLIIPRIDPLGVNIEKFRKYYDWFIIIFSIFFLLIYSHTILWNLGFQISPLIPIFIGIGFLFFYIGVLLEKAKRNWFIGIRTPWTLSSDIVWEKTHKIGGKMFKIIGIIAIFGIIIPEYGIFLILASIIFIIVYTTIYSYFEYIKEKKNN